MEWWKEGELRIKLSTLLNHSVGNVASVTWTFNTQHVHNGCVTEAFQCHMCRRIEDCRGWWLSGCRSSVAEYCYAHNYNDNRRNTQGEKPNILATCSISLAVLHIVEGRGKSCAYPIIV